MTLDINTESSGTQPTLALPQPATARPTHSHSHAGRPAGAKPKLYNPRHPERTLRYKRHCDHHTPRPYVRQAFRKYLECGIFAHSFFRAWCACQCSGGCALSRSGCASSQRGHHPGATAADTQTIEGTLPVGSADRPHLLSLSAAVPAVWHADQEDPRSHRGGRGAPANFPGARATVVG